MDQGAERRHRVWLAGGRNYFLEQLRRIRSQAQQHLHLSQNLLMVMTLDATLLVSLRETMMHQGSSILELGLNLSQIADNSACMNPPSEEQKAACTVEICTILTNLQSLELQSVRRENVPAVLHLLGPTSRLATVQFSNCRRLPAAELASLVRATFSLQSLRTLIIKNADFSSKELTEAFCSGLDSSCLEQLVLGTVTFAPDLVELVAIALARSSTLVQLEYVMHLNHELFEAYCLALSENPDTQLQRLLLVQVPLDMTIDLRGNEGRTTGPDAAISQQIRNLLKWNVQRRTCPPLFAAIGSTESGQACCARLVEAITAVDVPVLHEYLVTNQFNLISLVQHHGRSRKRKRSNEE
ncbi:hypothetical protein MPSEU_000000700 [Mayamaea pseudoterrestris]|nr:hypothetical protein MPSEU_000000700 [Mayamaea pseudoterrestris]